MPVRSFLHSLWQLLHAGAAMLTQLNLNPYLS